MSFTFDPKEMADDLVALSRVGARYLAPQSLARMERLANDLRNAVANSAAAGNAGFGWKTPVEAPIQISTSRWWKGDTEDFAPLTANVSVDYKCTPCSSHGRLLAKGVTAIRILGGAQEKGFHFDADDGGWTENVAGVVRGRAGHPALHVQFYGAMNDIPRLPTLIVHPVDVISLAFLELHQKKWREHLTSAQGRSQLRLIPVRQRARMGATLANWRQRITNPEYLPIVGMQAPCAPLMF